MTTPSPDPADSTDNEAIHQRLAQVQNELHATQARLAGLEQRFGWMNLPLTDQVIIGMSLILSALLGGIGFLWLMRFVGAAHPAVIFAPLVVGLILPIWFVPPLVRFARTYSPHGQRIIALALVSTASLAALWCVALILW